MDHNIQGIHCDAVLKAGRVVGAYSVDKDLSG